MTKRDIYPDHPGIILKEEFLEPMGIRPGTLSRALQVSRDRIAELVKGKRDVTPDTALRLGAFFDMSPEFWLNLQYHYDLVITEKDFSTKILNSIKMSRKEFVLLSH
ncbi:HigA family addiction module antitoxin [Mucilaginibacter sp.]|uniref:HigA family addiction module antitoxin n=1 Tax=Mucilaginibacter sp. TaxID=1882438 RepID=UPI0035BC0A73